MKTIYEEAIKGHVSNGIRLWELVEFCNKYIKIKQITRIQVEDHPLGKVAEYRLELSCGEKTFVIPSIWFSVEECKSLYAVIHALVLDAASPDTLEEWFDARHADDDIPFNDCSCDENREFKEIQARKQELKEFLGDLFKEFTKLAARVKL